MIASTVPTFLCIGVQKAGTSWLYEMVRQHPGVCVSAPKELHFFNRSLNYQKGIDWYISHFSTDKNTQAAGEFTPDYLWGQDDRWLKGQGEFANVPERILKTFPDLRFLVVLRNPVTRAISAYFHHIGAGRLSARQRLGDVGDFWGIRSMGHYAENLKRWFALFPRDRFEILIYEDDFSAGKKAATFARVFKHIGVDTSFKPTGATRSYNKRRSHYDYRLSRLPGRLQRALRRFTPEFVENVKLWHIPVTNSEIAMLEEYYRPHNECLAAYLDRSLPW